MEPNVYSIESVSSPRLKALSMRQHVRTPQSLMGLEIARALLFGSHAPARFWTEAVSTAVDLLNRLPYKALNFDTPLQVLSRTHSLPPILMLEPRLFWLCGLCDLPKVQWSKLDPCALKCIFLGYGPQQKGYCCYDPLAHRLYVSMDVTFIEEDLYFGSHTQTDLQGGQAVSEVQSFLVWLCLLAGVGTQSQGGQGGTTSSVISLTDRQEQSIDAQSTVDIRENVQADACKHMHEGDEHVKTDVPKQDIITDEQKVCGDKKELCNVDSELQNSDKSDHVNS